MLWLTAKDVEILHRAQLAEHGGLPGVKDENALQSTLARPQQLLHYEPDASIYRLAASLGYGFARNHVFNDGNKRVAFLTMFGLLGINDYRLHVSEEEAVSVMLSLAAGELSEAELAAWLEANSDRWED